MNIGKKLICCFTNLLKQFLTKNSFCNLKHLGVTSDRNIYFSFLQQFREVICDKKICGFFSHFITDLERENCFQIILLNFFSKKF